MARPPRSTVHIQAHHSDAECLDTLHDASHRAVARVLRRLPCPHELYRSVRGQEAHGDVAIARASSAAGCRVRVAASPNDCRITHAPGYFV
jgi:hypothetical protein